ncbi:MAG: DNA replication and repair protein RecF [Lentisphaerota bacterium]
MIGKLGLSDFRNYQSLSLIFESKTNLIIGDNGQGKTNLLEAIYYLSFLRSFKTSHLEYLKRVGSTGFYLSGNVLNNNYSKTLEVYNNDKKILKIDGVSINKASEFVGFIKPVVFTHDDIKLISSTAKLRRRYLDILISSLDKLYFSDLQNYAVALKSRNILLKSANVDNNLISAYEPILAKYGKRILDIRYKVISQLQQRADKIIKKIKGETYNLQIIYYSRIKEEQNSEENILSLINKDKEKDRFRAYTGIGPHMDDIFFYLNGKSLKNYGSIGECRLATLCLKLAEAQLVTENDKSNSIALVDDVTGELDSKTKDAFFSVTEKFNQLFFTFTKYSDDSLFNSGAKYTVSNGMVNS